MSHYTLGIDAIVKYNFELITTVSSAPQLIALLSIFKWKMESWSIFDNLILRLKFRIYCATSYIVILHIEASVAPHCWSMYVSSQCFALLNLLFTTNSTEWTRLPCL